MTNTCVNCGNELRAGAKFCLQCGTKQPEGMPQQSVQAQPPQMQPPQMQAVPQPSQMEPPHGGTVCVNCGNTLRAGAKFCLQCGTKQPEGAPQPSMTAPPQPENKQPSLTRAPELSGQSAAMQQRPPQPAQVQTPIPAQGMPQSPVQPAAVPPVQPAAMAQNAMRGMAGPGMQAAFFQLQGQLNASAMPGEIALGEFGNTATNAMNMARGAAGAMRGAAGAVRGMANGQDKKDTVKAFVSAGILAFVWVVQIILARKGIDNPLTKIGNFLTFGKGGLNRNIIGLAGGILGKGIVATALVSVVCNARSIGSGFKRMFKGSDSGSIVLALIGGAVAILLYWFFTGNMKATGMMAAFSGVVVAASSLGSRGGIIYRGLSAITSKTVNGRKIPSHGKTKSLLTGISAGFVIAAAASAVISVIGLIS